MPITARFSNSSEAATATDLAGNSAAQSDTDIAWMTKIAADGLKDQD